MRNLVFISLSLLVSCKTKDTKMCACLEAGEKLNKLSAKLLTTEVTEAQKDAMLKLKAIKKEKCKDFQTMSGEEMLKRKATCQIAE
jgi:hypothetical protein